MDVGSPESPGLKPRPLHASRRGRHAAARSLQQPPDFLTDSLNTTFIPSPSPKPRSRQGLQAKPRQKLDRKELAAAYQATANRKENNSPRPKLTSAQSEPLHKLLTSSRGTNVLSPRVLAHGTTPERSPRRRADSLLSPESDSSPPHGLAEAYQRIGAETDLADSIDDGDLVTFAYPDDLENVHEKSLGLSRTVSARSSRRVSPQGPMSPAGVGEVMGLDGSRDGERMVEEDATQSSTGSGSSQFAKDADRVSRIVNGNVQAFSKAKLGDRGRLTAENLRRTNGSNESLRSAFSGSGSRMSEPSLNLPKQWGRNAKPGLGLFTRVTGRTPDERDSPSKPAADTKDAASLAAASATPLPDSSPLTKSTSSASTSRTAFQHKAPIEMRPAWDTVDDDFTGRSLQVSESPPIRQVTLNRNHEVEIEKLEKQAVTTSRLGQIKDKLSNGTLRRKFLTFEEPDEYGKSDGDQSMLADNVESAHTVEELGAPIPDTPVVVYRKSQMDSDNKPGEKAQPHNLLRRLSRAASDSPVSNGPKTNAQPFEVACLSTKKLVAEQLTPKVTGGWMDETLQSTAPSTVSKPNLKTPKVTGGWIETPMPAGGRTIVPKLDEEEPSKPEIIEEAKEAPETLKAKAPPLKYTGPPLPKSALDQIIKDVKSGRKIKAPGSDTEDEQTLLLGESTVQDLEDLIENDTDSASPPSQLTSPPSSDPSPAKPTTQTLPDDPNAYANLLSRLTNLGPSLRASKRQIASLERTVSAPSSKTAVRQHETECNEAGELHDFLLSCSKCGNHIPMPRSLPIPTLSTLPLPSLLTIHNITSSATTTITIPIPRLWTWPRNSRPRLTWLGTTILSIYLCLVAESWARYNFCQPEFASSMVGYGVDINAPEPPFVFLKVLWRYSHLEDIVGPARGFARAVSRICTALFLNFLDAFMGLNLGRQTPTGVQSDAMPTPQQQQQSAPRDPRPGWGPDLGLGDDEFL